jgi:hypothetical protein
VILVTVDRLKACENRDIKQLRITNMLSSNGAFIYDDKSITVINDRQNFGFQVAEPTLMRYEHPFLGSVLLEVSTFKGRKEVRYYNLPIGAGKKEDLLINLERDPRYNLINEAMSATKWMPFRWYEYECESIARVQQHVPDIFQKWGELQNNGYQKPDAGVSTIEIDVKNYPTAGGDKISFVATAEVESGKIPWYSAEFHAASYCNGWGAKPITARTTDGQEIDLTVYFSPDRRTFYGIPRLEYGDKNPLTDRRRRVANPPRKLATA